MAAPMPHDLTSSAAVPACPSNAREKNHRTSTQRVHVSREAGRAARRARGGAENRWGFNNLDLAHLEGECWCNYKQV